MTTVHKEPVLAAATATTVGPPGAAEGLDAAATRAAVAKYYGTTLQSAQDLKTGACCAGAAPPERIRGLLRNVAAATQAKYYGCGLCLPDYDLTGAHLLDLGCGAGRDVYLASQLVGPQGRVVGVDMSPELLRAARDVQDHHSERFGYRNTAFYQGYLESLAEVPELEPNTFDVIISNCVINLCTDKPAVLAACYDLLKPGGELYFSDVYANRRVPLSLQKDELLWGECISGALYWNDFENMARRVGFRDPRLVEDAPITVGNKAVACLFAREGQVGLEFYSATYRLFKMDDLEPASEDYGQAVIYKGTIPHAESSWTLDKHHTMETGRVVPVCGNTYKMLHDNPRLSPHFEFLGSWERHYGPYLKRGDGLPFTKASPTKGKAGSCGPTGACC